MEATAVIKVKGEVIGKVKPMTIKMKETTYCCVFCKGPDGLHRKDCSWLIEYKIYKNHGNIH